MLHQGNSKEAIQKSGYARKTYDDGTVCPGTGPCYSPFHNGSQKLTWSQGIDALATASILVPGLGEAGLIFKSEHYASRLIAEGMSVSGVESAVGSVVSSIRADMVVDAAVRGRMVVQNRLIEWRARLLSDGTINVGTIFPVK